MLVNVLLGYVVADAQMPLHALVKAEKEGLEHLELHLAQSALERLVGVSDAVLRYKHR